MHCCSGVLLSLLAGLCVAGATTSDAADGKHVWDFRARATEEHKVKGEAPGGLFGNSVAATDLYSIIGSPGQ
jgi:hypothetical protein